MKATTLVRNLKQVNEDYEWYPTTREIIEAMYWDLVGKKIGEETYRAGGRRYSMLDIGAGNCKVLNTIREIAEEQPLLSEKWTNHKGQENEYTYSRMEGERFANRVFITKYMAIEKSQILTDLMPKETLIVGTNFHENTLIDKQSDVIFCNPPYSEYEQWATRIIREGNANTIYLVIPQRWGKHKGIAQALKDRKAKVKIIGNFDFFDSEDRKARAYVSLVKVELNHKKYRGDRYARRDSSVNVDPFDLWFNDTFKISAEKSSDDYDSIRRNKKKTDEREKKIKQEMVAGNGLIPVLVELYNKELDHLVQNYKKLSGLDAEIFKELNVDVDSVLNAFKEKIKGLKNFYWDEVFSNLTEITSRLTNSSRDKLKSKLMANASIDFTESNIRSILIWVLKNANHYYEEQMLDLYDTFTTEEGIKLYKSNQHFVKDDFRYNKREGKLGKYALDYRIILHSYIDDWDIREGRISDRQYENIRDVSVIAKNLGFDVKDEKFKFANRYDKVFAYGKKENIFFGSSEILKKGEKTLEGKVEEVYMHTSKPNENGERVMEKDGILYVYDEDNESDWIQYKIGGVYFSKENVFSEKNIFTTVKPYKNGNCHFQFNQKFIKKLNLEVGRIRGWLKDPKHAAEEMDITIEEATEFWNSTFTMLPEKLSNLLPAGNSVIDKVDINEINLFDEVIYKGEVVSVDESLEGERIICDTTVTPYKIIPIEAAIGEIEMHWSCSTGLFDFSKSEESEAAEFDIVDMQTVIAQQEDTAVDSEGSMPFIEKTIVKKEQLSLF